MSEQLFVYFRESLIGTIAPSTSKSMHFEYGDAWKKSSDSFPISLSLPLNGMFTDAASHPFFANLLPEGNVREQICKSLRISSDNDYELLKAIGGDCAGALTITTSSGINSMEGLPQYEPVTEEQLSNWSLGTPNAFADVTGQNQVRLSLAGAQDKLPVHVEGDQIMIPLGNAPSTHILKFASRYYSHLPENETFITLLAREVGLPVVDVRVRKTAKSAITVIQRYDRQWESRRWHRLHQEDFCQALGIHASRKYEKEGGPSLKQCSDIIRQHTSFPLVELQKLILWTLFNFMVGNADAHGKNLSILYSPIGTSSLAPFYDLVCTRNYKRLSREMAMRLGGSWDPDLVSSKHLDGVAQDLGFRSSFVHNQANDLSKRILDLLPKAMESYGNQFGDSPVLERLPLIIRKLIRRLRSLLTK